jgi:hypothetical protein
MADRYDRKRIMVGACFVQAVFVALIPPLISFGIVWLYVLVALSSCARQFYSPAYESVLPRSPLTRSWPPPTRSCRSARWARRRWATPPPDFWPRSSPQWVFYIDALTFVVAGLCLMGITVQKLGNDEETNVAWSCATCAGVWNYSSATACCAPCC